jgi:hypothetical protein
MKPAVSFLTSFGSTVNFKIIKYVHLKNQEIDLLQFFPCVKMPF